LRSPEYAHLKSDDRSITNAAALDGQAAEFLRQNTRMTISIIGDGCVHAFRG